MQLVVMQLVVMQLVAMEPAAMVPATMALSRAWDDATAVQAMQWRQGGHQQAHENAFIPWKGRIHGGCRIHLETGARSPAGPASWA